MDKAQKFIVFATLTVVPLLFQPLTDRILGGGLSSGTVSSSSLSKLRSAMTGQLPEAPGSQTDVSSKASAQGSHGNVLIALCGTTLIGGLVLFCGKWFLDRSIPADRKFCEGPVMEPTPDTMSRPSRSQG